MTRWRRSILGCALALAVASASCGSDAGNPTTAASSEHGANEAIDFGEPAPPEAGDRTVRVTALDALALSPAHIAVAKDETITFEVTNTGENRHDFVIGDANFQKEHEREMASGDMSMQYEDNTLVLDPGQTGTLAWTFTQAGEVLYGCHEPGHYEGGMVGLAAVHRR
jgi:uncharacterized cupredoxin-like copper-binding protein